MAEKHEEMIESGGNLSNTTVVRGRLSIASNGIIRHSTHHVSTSLFTHGMGDGANDELLESLQRSMEEVEVM